MVISDRLPASGLVTKGAIVSQAARMRVLAGMAAMAGLGHWGFQVAAFMAGVAADLVVVPLEWKASLFQMVEARVFPTHRAVAVSAGRTTTAAMHIVRCMTGITLRGRTFKGGIAMAAGASRLFVSTEQCKLGLGMVELGGLEGFHLMTGGALFSELPVVNIILFVTSDAGLWRLAMLLTGLVTTGAGGGGVPTLEAEIGLVMTKCGGLKSDNVGAATLMLAMTPGAPGIGWQGTAVEPLLGLHIGSNVFVTGQTQDAHARFVGTIMAIRALLFVFHVSGR